MFYLIEEKINYNYLINFLKLIIIVIIFKNSYYINNRTKNIQTNILHDWNNHSFSYYKKNISINNYIYFAISNVDYIYSKKYQLIEIKYCITSYNSNNSLIKPSDVSLIYKLHILCSLYIYENEEYIYSNANIDKNELFYCIEYIKIVEHVKLGINIFSINQTNEEIENNQHFFFTDKLINFKFNKNLINNNKFDNHYLYNKYYKILLEIKKSKKAHLIHKKPINLISFFLMPPFCSLKRDIALVEGKWFFNNIYGNYFCFCKGNFCTNLKSFLSYNHQDCKYHFYLTLLESHRNLYKKTDFLLSDFFEENTESVDAFPIFEELLKLNLNAYYLTMSKKLYDESNFNNSNSYKKGKIIYGIKKINGDFIEYFFELLLRLKAVITSEKFEGISNLFYNIDYITYIFLGHGVTYIKSYLYNNYLSCHSFNKILLPQCEKFINLALEAGWKNEDIIKIGYPRWDRYAIHKNNNLKVENNLVKEKAIFLMFTWRKVKKNKKISDLYFNNLYNLLNNKKLNHHLHENNIIIYFCFHHKLKIPKKIKINQKIILANQNDISNLLKNSSLLITDFSSIIFDAIVQKKPIILYVPDGLDPNLKDIYINEYYETIIKLKNGLIYLYEIFFSLRRAIKKIIYYIDNDFQLEKEKLNFYNEFKLENGGNTKNFIKYIKTLK